MLSSEINSQLQKIFSPLRTERAKRLTVKDNGDAGSAKQISLSGRRALADRIQRGLDELAERRGKISYALIAERSGNLITEGAITNLLSQRVGNPALLTLYGLARALEIDPQELFNAALGIAEPEGLRESLFWKLFEDYKQIRDKANQDLVDVMLGTVRHTIDGARKKAAPPERLPKAPPPPMSFQVSRTLQKDSVSPHQARPRRSGERSAADKEIKREVERLKKTKNRKK